MEMSAERTEEALPSIPSCTAIESQVLLEHAAHRSVTEYSILEMLLVENTRHLWHPFLSVGAEEFSLGWQRSRVLKGPSHNVAKVVSRSRSIFENATTTLAAEFAV